MQHPFPDEQLVRDAFQWDTVNWSRALELWWPFLSVDKELDVLEIGSRQGGLSLLAAKCGHRVVCSDLASPENTARPLHERYGVADRITYAAADAVSLPWRERFDIILFKSVLGGIGRDGQAQKQHLAVNQMRHALKPGGVILFAENLVGSPLHRIARYIFQPWGRSWRYVHFDELPGLYEGCHAFEWKTTGCAGAFGRSEGMRERLGRMDRSFLTSLTPARWRYIAYGVAHY